MKKSLSHLPKHKQAELKLITRIIRKQFPSAHMIILFGSYARGQWVEDTYTEGHITYGYTRPMRQKTTRRNRKDMRSENR
ncbi:MAG: nucleotidyltransferase domain-containing protein [Planctomycetota bacterium]